jgi:hypothetical protein
MDIHIIYFSAARPYVVECGDAGIFWKVTSDNSLTVTRNSEEASVFRIVSCDDTEDKDDFNIGWRGETQQDIQELEGSDRANSKIMRYLEVKPYFFGHCSNGPLKLKSELKSKDSRLCLYNRITKGCFESCEDSIAPWTEMGKVFFISNAAWKSYVSVMRYRNKEQADPDQEDAYGYTTKCMGSRRAHNEKDIWMLFRLIPQMEKVSTMGKIKNRLGRELAKYTET